MQIKRPPIKTKQSEIWVDSNGILWVKFAENSDIDLEEVITCFTIYNDLGFGGDNKALQLIDGRNNFTITTEARAFAAQNGSAVFLASAIVAESLATRLLVNFFNRFYKQPVPFKMFNSEQKAREWLIKFKT